MKQKVRNYREEDCVVYTVREAARMLKINHCLAYALVREGRIPALHLGARIVIPRDRFERMLKGEER